VNRGVTFENGRTDRRGMEKRRQSKRVKVNINFVSRGGPDRAASRSAGSLETFSGEMRSRRYVI